MCTQRHAVILQTEKICTFMAVCLLHVNQPSDCQVYITEDFDILAEDFIKLSLFLCSLDLMSQHCKKPQFLIEPEKLQCNYLLQNGQNAHYIMFIDSLPITGQIDRTKTGTNIKVLPLNGKEFSFFTNAEKICHSVQLCLGQQTGHKALDLIVNYNLLRSADGIS